MWKVLFIISCVVFLLAIDFLIKKYQKEEIADSFEKEAQGQKPKTDKKDCPIMLHEYVLNALPYKREIIRCDCPEAREILGQIDKKAICHFDEPCPVRVFINKKQ